MGIGGNSLQYMCGYLYLSIRAVHTWIFVAPQITTGPSYSACGLVKHWSAAALSAAMIAGGDGGGGRVGGGGGGGDGGGGGGGGDGDGDLDILSWLANVSRLTSACEVSDSL